MRRKLLLAAAVGAGALLSAGVACAQTIKIGIINSYSGFLAQGGDQMEKGLNLYIKQNEGKLPPGVKIEIVRRDDGGAPETGKRVAQELITREKVSLLIGVISSPVAAAVAPLTKEAKIPFILTNAAGVGIPRISPYVARVSFTLWQSGLPMGQWSAKQGWKTAFTAVTDYIPGHDAEGAFTKGFTDAGGKIVGSVRFPTSTADYAPFVQRIKDAKPDVAFVWVPAGNHATAVMKAVKDLGLIEANIKIVSTQDLLPDEELPNIGDIAIGLITAGTYSLASDRPANKDFVAAWDKEYQGKAIADYMSVGGYDGMAMVFDMLKATGGKFDGDAAMKFFANWKRPDSPRGPIEIDPLTRDVIQNVYIRRTEKKDGKLVNTEFETIPMVKDPWKELNPAK